MRVQEVVETLRRWLEAGTLDAEDRLPPERELARRLEVSRGTLRRALAALEDEGRVWRHVGRGTFAGDRPRQFRADDLARLIGVTSPTEVMEVRRLLEPRIAALAALRATPLDLREMEQGAARCEAATDAAAFERWDGRLHRLIARAARNTMLLTLFDTINAARQGELWGRLKAESLTPERHGTYVRQHARVVAAIRDRDGAAAAREMDEHLATVQRHLLG